MTAATAQPSGPADRLSDLFWRRPRLLLALLLAPPLLWLGIVYLGSLFALLAQSFFSIDEFSGVIDRTFTLRTYAELLRPANLDIIVRTVTMAALVSLASIALAFLGSSSVAVCTLRVALNRSVNARGAAWPSAAYFSSAASSEELTRRCSASVSFVAPPILSIAPTMSAAC